jgi:hypothetical protein
MVGVVCGLIAASGAISESRAQSLDPLLPPISAPKAKYFAEHPEAYQEFLSKLPRRPVETIKTAPAKVAPTAGGTWTALPAAPNGAGLYAPHLLTDGTVLIENGTNPQWYKLTPNINGSYVNGTWSTIAVLPVINGQQYAPLYHASAVLPDGRLAIQGGEYNYNQLNASGQGEVFTNLGAIYDPVANAWTAVTRPSNLSAVPTGYDGVIGDAPSTVLDNGTWLLGGCCASPDADDLFNASTLGWTSTSAPSSSGYYYQDEQGYEKLPNGNVLTIDVWDPNANANSTSAEQYQPSSGTWVSAGNTPVSLVDPYQCANYEIGPAVLRPDGTLVAFGGYSLATCTVTPAPATVDPTAIYNSSTGAWTAGPSVPTVCNAPNTQGCTLADAPAAMLPNGNILFAASAGYSTAPTHFFEYTAANGINQVSDPLFNASILPAFVYNFVVLPNGQILMTDGSNTPEVYTPSAGVTANTAPGISTAPPVVIAGDTYQITGTQFNGLSEGADFGDDAQTATNYPIVQSTNVATSHVFYDRTFAHSNRSMAPGAAVSTNFSAPLNIEPGPSKLAVIANGIASAPVTVSVKYASTAFPPDFNADAKSDILWRDSSGDVVLWLMSGGTISSSAYVGNPGAGWSIAGTGDFSGNGKSDILWRNTTTGDVVIWFMNGGVIQSSTDLGVIPTSWSIVGIGDFNGDGKSDILWSNTDGAVNIWLMNGGTISSAGTVGSLPSGWTVQGTGDLNANGTADIVWRNSNGDVVVWLMNGLSITSSADLGIIPEAYSINGVADLNGDGRADILWHNSDGDTVVWFMSGETITSSADLGTIPASWSIAGTGDFNGDTKADILWRNTDGDTVIWFMNGGTITSSTDLGNLSFTQWTVVQ